jgi:hypothetical protein
MDAGPEEGQQAKWTAEEKILAALGMAVLGAV